VLVEVESTLHVSYTVVHIFKTGARNIASVKHASIALYFTQGTTRVSVDCVRNHISREPGNNLHGTQISAYVAAQNQPMSARDKTQSSACLLVATRPTKTFFLNVLRPQYLCHASAAMLIPDTVKELVHDIRLL
jgi:hypothetical protein